MTDQLRASFTGISPTTRAALEKMAPAEAVSVMDEMLHLVAGNNNNNNNSGEIASAGLSRDQLLEKINVMSDDQLHATLKQQGII